ncbi:hypothetical protein TrVE_jg9801 [Triparma verrucosa]|uniref:Glutathione S-transferase n=1 Tax=Triparma verrucosa TaxID=1606542 RepID=A0A9W7B2Z8_9STRA|nr:hypothetical protein TrVE_jg9801 [Triparma verrucosa]
MFGDVLGALKGGGGEDGVNLALDISLGSVWEDLASSLHAKQTPSERAFRADVAKGTVSSPFNRVRLFNGDTEEDCRVTLYRDSASWCPYCQKVWTMLEQKEISYKVVKVNMRCYGSKPAEFTRLQPNGNIPVAVIDGTVYRQSNDIMFALEKEFPDKVVMGLGEEDGERGTMLLRLERELFRKWMYYLTGSRDKERYRAEFLDVFKRVDDELGVNKSGRGFMLGDRVTIVDMMYAPFLERIVASMAYFKGLTTLRSDEFSNVKRWFEAMERLPSYRLTKSDFYTHCWDLPPQLGGCVYEYGEDEGRGEEITRAIDGDEGWRLPLSPDNGGVEKDWSWISEDEAKREAAERLSYNHDAVAEFAARGAGKAGFPPVSAPLADPNANFDEGIVQAVDAALALSCYKLLGGGKMVDELEAAIAKVLEKQADAERFRASLAYLRDRVGVPRDMSLPAARWTRATINEIINMK